MQSFSKTVDMPCERAGLISCGWASFAACVFLMLATGPASAGIISISGDLIESPPTTQTDKAQIELRSENITAFVQNLPLAFPITSATRFLPVGTLFSFYRINFRPAVSGGFLGDVQGSVTFDEDILGLWEYSQLEADNVQGTNTADSVTISPDARTLTFALNVNSQNSGDVFDFFVARVPEPATLALIGIGLAGLGVGRRRKAH